jgi:NADH dehydrogenase [ubiquinone] 1 alpha subcomplex assembly factor 7
MTPLAQVLATRIRAHGPMSLADYMAECLLHPQFGYYTTQNPFGAQGDFITAPEISQMFGELLGLCLAQAWIDQGAPDPFTLAELGPGRGTLMADILRATRSVPGLHAAMRVVLVEASPRLRAIQAQTLQSYRPAWVDSVQDLPRHPLFLVANEFFDALPIRQFQRAGLGWRERLVGLNDDALAFGLGPIVPIAGIADRLADTTDGDLVELCPQAPAIMAEIAARIKDKGAALIIDYGGWRSLGDTFQAMQAHQPVDPFATPGQADLTAHVDFAALAQAAHPAAHAYTTQGALLSALGIAQRSARLAQNLSGAALQSHLAATQRLTAPAEMGTLFKVLALHPAHHPAPPGSA